MRVLLGTDAHLEPVATGGGGGGVPHAVRTRAPGLCPDGLLIICHQDTKPRCGIPRCGNSGAAAGTTCLPGAQTEELTGHPQLSRGPADVGVTQLSSLDRDLGQLDEVADRSGTLHITILAAIAASDTYARVVDDIDQWRRNRSACRRQLRHIREAVERVTTGIRRHRRNSRSLVRRGPAATIAR